jgi:hypothetical protein
MLGLRQESHSSFFNPQLTPPIRIMHEKTGDAPAASVFIRAHSSMPFCASCRDSHKCAKPDKHQ